MYDRLNSHSRTPMDTLVQLDLPDKLIRFSDCYLLQGERLIREDLWICNGLILDGLDLFFREKRVADVRIELNGSIITPGFIDIQVNGAYGFDFSNPHGNMREGCARIARKLTENGVTSFCPTIITSSRQAYDRIIPQFEHYQDSPDAARMLGLHLEGPFISRSRPGMHPTDHMLEFGPDPVQTITDTYGSNLGVIRIVTIAPELLGSKEAIEYLVSQGVVVSIGHTTADGNSLEDAMNAGATFLTHLFNAMPLFHHRQSHLLDGLVNHHSSLYTGLIADLAHVHPAALRMAETIAPGRVVLITDANTAFGLPDGAYTFGDRNIDVTNGLAYVKGTRCLAGGTTPLSVCIRNFWQEVCSQIPEAKDDSPWPGLGRALSAASTRPALGLGLYQPWNSGKRLVRGSLVPGAYADLAILCPEALSTPTPELRVLSTWIEGKPVHINTNSRFHIKTSSFSCKI
ncbi:Amidohydrolase domain containing 2 [Fasciolopsis buskii]|uniref:N-acetylglucosamine-6-phosphate deacetylase n=1 Tax=Fasciolopsis buskii TaxID=27845 RepID=A0A8E0RTP1_9TREM|nr:Amidohydrolase domain containing 2 [Fasciolopsis buski]